MKQANKNLQSRIKPSEVWYHSDHKKRMVKLWKIEMNKNHPSIILLYKKRKNIKNKRMAKIRG